MYGGSAITLRVDNQSSKQRFDAFLFLMDHWLFGWTMELGGLISACDGLPAVLPAGMGTLPFRPAERYLVCRVKHEDLPRD